MYLIEFGLKNAVCGYAIIGKHVICACNKALIQSNTEQTVRQG